MLVVKSKFAYYCIMPKVIDHTLEEIPVSVKNTDVLKLIDEKYNPRYFIILKDFTGSNDKDISDWLNISVKTFQKYKKPTKKEEVKEDTVEHAVMLLSLFKHGKNIFGDHHTFSEWLQKENFYFGKKKPAKFLNTISGIKFIDNRLTAIEYGDNV